MVHLKSINVSTSTIYDQLTTEIKDAARGTLGNPLIVQDSGSVIHVTTTDSMYTESQKQ